MENLVVSKKVVTDWGLPYDDNPELGVNIIEDRIVDHSRWSVIHELVVEINGKIYITKYSVAATERQDERPWQYDREVVFKPATKITVEKWVEVKSANV